MVPLVFHPIYSQLSLTKNHRFPIDKYQGIRDALRNLGVSDENFYEPKAVKREALKRVLEPAYVDDLLDNGLSAKAMKRIGFPWSEQLILRTLTAVGGTLLASDLALERGKAINLTGGYHHAFANFGSGFCMINDLYLAALSMQQHRNVDRVLIFDCDVHQGDGTAKLAANNEQVMTVSIHGEKNFPHRKQQSDMDFPLVKGTGDDEYLQTVDSALHLAISSFQPDAVIYDAGVDVHINDDLGHLDISTGGILARDICVFDTCERHSLPVVAVIGGGYQRNIDELVDVHLQLFKAAKVY